VSTEAHLDHIRSFEGLRVSLALRDGSRIDDCQLISAGRAQTTNVWVFADGMDVFVPARSVIDVWEVVAQRNRRVA
jgi:hypothetical protein